MTRPGSFADQLVRLRVGQEAAILCTDIQATSTAGKVGVRISTNKCYIVVPGQKRMIEATLVRRLEDDVAQG
jgi:hypothetical protein